MNSFGAQKGMVNHCEEKNISFRSNINALPGNDDSLRQ